MGEKETQAILQGKRKVVTSCGSGMTAAVLWLGLNLLGVKGVALYDEVRSFALVSEVSVDRWNDCIVSRVGPGMP